MYSKLDARCKERIMSFMDLQDLMHMAQVDREHRTLSWSNGLYLKHLRHAFHLETTLTGQVGSRNGVSRSLCAALTRLLKERHGQPHAQLLRFRALYTNGGMSDIEMPDGTGDTAPDKAFRMMVNGAYSTLADSNTNVLALLQDVDPDWASHTAKVVKAACGLSTGVQLPFTPPSSPPDPDLPPTPKQKHTSQPDLGYVLEDVNPQPSPPPPPQPLDISLPGTSLEAERCLGAEPNTTPSTPIGRPPPPPLKRRETVPQLITLDNDQMHVLDVSQSRRLAVPAALAAFVSVIDQLTVCRAGDFSCPVRTGAILAGTVTRDTPTPLAWNTHRQQQASQGKGRRTDGCMATNVGHAARSGTRGGAESGSTNGVAGGSVWGAGSGGSVVTPSASVEVPVSVPSAIEMAMTWGAWAQAQFEILPLEEQGGLGAVGGNCMGMDASGWGFAASPMHAFGNSLCGGRARNGKASNVQDDDSMHVWPGQDSTSTSTAIVQVAADTVMDNRHPVEKILATSLVDVQPSMDVWAGTGAGQEERKLLCRAACLGHAGQDIIREHLLQVVQGCDSGPDLGRQQGLGTLQARVSKVEALFEESVLGAEREEVHEVQRRLELAWLQAVSGQRSCGVLDNVTCLADVISLMRAGQLPRIINYTLLPTGELVEFAPEAPRLPPSSATPLAADLAAQAGGMAVPVAGLDEGKARPQSHSQPPPVPLQPVIWFRFYVKAELSHMTDILQNLFIKKGSRALQSWGVMPDDCLTCLEWDALLENEEGPLEPLPPAPLPYLDVELEPQEQLLPAPLPFLDVELEQQEQQEQQQEQQQQQQQQQQQNGTDVAGAALLSTVAMALPQTHQEDAMQAQDQQSIPISIQSTVERQQQQDVAVVLGGQGQSELPTAAGSGPWQCMVACMSKEGTYLELLPIDDSVWVNQPHIQQFAFGSELVLLQHYSHKWRQELPVDVRQRLWQQLKQARQQLEQLKQQQQRQQLERQLERVHQLKEQRQQLLEELKELLPMYEQAEQPVDMCWEEEHQQMLKLPRQPDSGTVPQMQMLQQTRELKQEQDQLSQQLKQIRELHEQQVRRQTKMKQQHQQQQLEDVSDEPDKLTHQSHVPILLCPDIQTRFVENFVPESEEVQEVVATDMSTMDPFMLLNHANMAHAVLKAPRAANMVCLKLISHENRIDEIDVEGFEQDAPNQDIMWVAIRGTAFRLPQELQLMPAGEALDHGSL